MFDHFESGIGENLGKTWVCYNCSHVLKIEEVKLDLEFDIKFVVCPNCRGRGVYVKESE